MKKILLFSLLISGAYVHAQSLSFLEFNGARALCSNTGVFFQNEAISTPGYEIPNGSNKHTIYSNSLWITAKNSSGTLLGSAATYGGGSYDLFPGPIADDYNDPEFIQFDRIWMVSQADILNHQVNYNNPGYTMPSGIADWPGNGNTDLGMAAKLAPFADYNNNGIYEPTLGEHPCIKGDVAHYTILNDEGGTRSVTGLPSMKLEVHLMFYQFNTSNHINNTTFYEVTIHNRSDVTYSDVKLGSFADFDIGGSIDDYIGSDSTRNLMYAYNGDHNDEGANGALGYGTHPPAAGIKLLDQTATSVVSFSRLGTGGAINGVNTDPVNGADFNAYLSGYFLDGSPMTNSDGGLTKFAYNAKISSEFTEVQVSNSPGDRRAVMACSFNDLAPNETISTNYAVIYFKDENVDLFDPVSGLLEVADSVQTFYDNLTPNCMTAGISSISAINFNLYPNPANSYFQIELPGTFDYQLVNMEGKIIQQNKGNYEFAKINIEGIPSGIYFVEVAQDQYKSFQKIIIQ